MWWFLGFYLASTALSVFALWYSVILEKEIVKASDYKTLLGLSIVPFLNTAFAIAGVYDAVLGIINTVPQNKKTLFKASNLKIELGHFQAMFGVLAKVQLFGDNTIFVSHSKDDNIAYAGGCYYNKKGASVSVFEGEYLICINGETFEPDNKNTAQIIAQYTKDMLRVLIERRNTERANIILEDALDKFAGRSKAQMELDELVNKLTKEEAK